MSTQTYVQKASPIGEDGVVRCYTHNLEAANRISRTAANPERAFFCCAKDMGDESRCKFFVWADDPIFRNRENHPPPTNVESPSTPRPSQRQRADQARQSSSPTKGGQTPATAGSQSPSTPSQRRLAIIQEAISPSPAKLTRLENIKAGLSQRTQSPTQSQSPMPPSAGVSTSPRKGNKPANIQGGPVVSSSPPQPSGPSQSHIQTTAPLRSNPRTTPPSENDTDVFYTPPPSQGSQSIRPSQTSSYYLPAPPDARSPKRAKLTHSPDSGSDGGIASGIGLLTPPQSSQRHSGVDGMSSDDTEPQTPTKDKGKGRDMRGAHLSQGFSIGTNPAPTTMPAPSPDALIATMEENLITLRAVMEKNERKRVAAEKSNDAKAKRIEDLEHKIKELEAKQEKESQGWKTKVRVLEETIGALKMRRPGVI